MPTRTWISVASFALLACTAAPPGPAPAPTVTRVATGLAFVEGPVWLPGPQAVVFSDIPASRLMRWDAENGLAEHAERDHPNGNLVDGEGRLITCQQGARNIVREERDGSLTVLVDRVDGKRFNSPNDAALRADGTLWFTDPPWGLPNQREGKELAGHWVFRVDPGTSTAVAVLTDFAMPNGIALSPDGSRLYVSDTGGHPSHPDATFHGRPATISAYAIDRERELSAAPLWRIEATSDGMCVAPDGRIFTTAKDGVAVFDADGEVLEHIPLPERPTNACLGGADGRTLFVTAGKSLYACTWH